MNHRFKGLTLSVIFMLVCTVGWAQLPKLNAGKLKDKAKKTAKKEANNAGGDAVQSRQKLETDCKNLEGNIAKGEWTGSGLSNIQFNLQSLARDIYKCTSSNNPAEKSLGKKYLEKYQGYLKTYQEKADMTVQQITPPMAEEQEKSAHAAFGKVSYAYKQLTNADKKPKNSWGEQEFVDNYKKNIDQVNAKAGEYKAIDTDNYADVDRYTEAVKANTKIYEERKEFPARRDAATAFMGDHGNQFRTMSKAAPEFQNHEAFEEAVRTFEWVEMRKHTDFMHEWEMRPSGNSVGVAYEMLDWVDEYPKSIKADLTKKASEATANASSMKYDYSKWQAAERNLAIAKASALLYPDDAAMTGSVAKGQTLRDSRFKTYEEVTYTSDYHRKNLFSVGVSTTGAKGFKPLTSIKAGDKVTFTVFFDRPVDLLVKEGRIVFGLDKIWDNEESFSYYVPAEDLGKSYVDIKLFTDKPYKEETHEAEEIILRELCMAKGKSVKAEISTGFGYNAKMKVKPLTFSFDGTNTAGITAYNTRWNSLNGKRLADVRVPKANASNAALEASFKKAFIAKYGDEDVKSVLKVRLDATDWSVSRNALTGIIISREHAAWVVYKRIDGTCRVENAGFEQQAQGGGKYGPTYWDGVGENFEIHCGNVNK